MTEEPNRRPLTPSGDSWTAADMDRPAPGPDAADDPGSTFPRDDAAEGQVTDRRHEPLPGSSGAGGPQAVDPGPADQTPEGPAGRPAWASGAPAGSATGGPASRGWGDQAQASSPADRSLEPAAASGSGSAPDQPGLDRFRERWASAQGAFVDDPKASVGEADHLVGEAIQDLEQRLTRRREVMHGQWTSGEPDTEQLRRLLHSYRALFNSLLEVRL